MNSNRDNPQKFNHYSYVGNNPLRYSDPTGNRACDDVDSLGGCITVPGGGGRGFGGLPRVIKPRRDEDTPGDLITVIPEGSACTGLPACVDLIGEYSPELPGWHQYHTYNLVCPANLHCTAAQMRDYLSRFVFLGQDPRNPVSDYQTNWVFAFTIIPLGQIQTRVSQDGLIAINYTQPIHAMRNGQVTRMAIQSPSGSWYVATTGVGNNVSVPIITGVEPSNIPVVISPEQYGELSLAPINQALGPVAFNQLDAAMLSYILANR